jgi:23S rRNA pseudouridine1911/1915/1917 synthase
VAGDPLYGGKRFKMGGLAAEKKQRVQEALDALRGQALHARRLAFTHPVTGERLAFEAPPPPDIEAFLAFLRSGGEHAVSD